MRLAVLFMLPILQRQAEKSERGKDLLGWIFDAPPVNGSNKHNNISV
jgi:hypothetical protein